MKKKWYIALIVFSSFQVIVAMLSFIGFFGYQSEGGAPSTKETREQVQSWLDAKPSRQNLNVAIMTYDNRERDLVPTIYLLQIWVVVLGGLSLSAGAVIFWMASHYHRQPSLQQTASPNGALARPLGDSGGSGGPPSVS